jgi:hypothetical protein
MAARFAAGGDTLAAIVREQQDLVRQRQSLDKELVQAVAQPPDKRAATSQDGVRRKYAETGAALDALNARIARDFPKYTEISNPKPLELSQVQALLGPEEAMLVYLVGDDGSWLWAVRRDRASMHRIRPVYHTAVPGC